MSNKTERYLLLLWRLSQSPGMRLSEAGLREILGNPSRASYYRMVNELTRGLGELPPLLCRVHNDQDKETTHPKNDNKNENIYFKLHSDGWENLASAKKEGQFLLECYKKLGHLLQSEYTKLIVNEDDQLEIDPNSNSKFSNEQSGHLKLNQKFIYLSKIQVRPFDFKKKSNLNQIIKALLIECEVTLAYQNLKGEKKIKRIHPLTLCHYRDDLYLLAKAWDESTSTWVDRTYKVNRIVEIKIHENEKFKYPTIEKWNPEQIFQLTSGIIRGPIQKAILKIYGHSKDILKEKNFYNSRVISECEDFIEYECSYSSVEEFLGQIFVYAQDIEVVSPMELREEFQSKANQALSRNSHAKAA
jgi:predicted DNA-binding transcriptional regulator YafY